VGEEAQGRGKGVREGWAFLGGGTWVESEALPHAEEAGQIKRSRKMTKGINNVNFWNLHPANVLYGG